MLALVWESLVGHAMGTAAKQGVSNYGSKAGRLGTLLYQKSDSTLKPLRRLLTAKSALYETK